MLDSSIFPLESETEHDEHAVRTDKENIVRESSDDALACVKVICPNVEQYCPLSFPFNKFIIKNTQSI